MASTHEGDLSEFRSVRVLGTLTLLGAIALLGSTAGGLAFSGSKMPLALCYANVGAALLDLLIGWGLRKESRAAWAFGVSMWAVLIAVNLLGVPHFAKAGAIGLLSAAFGAWRFALGVALVTTRRPLR